MESSNTGTIRMDKEVLDSYGDKIIVLMDEVNELHSKVGLHKAEQDIAQLEAAKGVEVVNAKTGESHLAFGSFPNTYFGLAKCGRSEEMTMNKLSLLKSLEKALETCKKLKDELNRLRYVCNTWKLCEEILLIYSDVPVEKKQDMLLARASKIPMKDYCSKYKWIDEPEFYSNYQGFDITDEEIENGQKQILDELNSDFCELFGEGNLDEGTEHILKLATLRKRRKEMEVRLFHLLVDVTKLELARCIVALGFNEGSC